ncbi:hypothetical protein BCR39DRAFT_544538 [Naematelia encephala]|uniref:Mmc1 C-terminal domain-containing protein n=1 Tax=Naematelia encephala TaxID=71784 RepID=A0A1Y2ATG4_9TREE|nr:hypothetical protein BCR39DRAFT_544538 [Naematelia encephala]
MRPSQLRSLTRQASKNLSVRLSVKTIPRSTAVRNVRTICPRRQYASTATALSFASTSDTSDSTRRGTALSVQEDSVRRTLEELERILRLDIGGTSEWTERISRSLDRLTFGQRGRIGVFGDVYAAREEVVTALLQDPLADTPSTRAALAGRHANLSNDVLEIQYGLTPSKSQDGLKLPSSFLQASGLDLVEITSTDSETLLSELLLADITVLVLDPIRLLSVPLVEPILSPLLAHRPVHLVVNGPRPSSVTEEDIKSRLHWQIKEASPDSDPATENITITLTDASQALSALESFSTSQSPSESQSTLSRTNAISSFQTHFLASHIGDLQTSLLASTAGLSNPESSSATSLAKAAVNHIDSIISKDRQATRTANDIIAQLRSHAAHAASRARHVSVATRGITGGVVQGGVDDELQSAKRGLEELFDGRWSWLGLVARLRVDDIGVEMANYLQRQFAFDLERQVIFETGQLAQLESQLSSQVNTTLRQLSSQPTSIRSSADLHIAAPHPFSSPLLINHLRSLSLSIPDLRSDSLTRPITARRDQLSSISGTQLQRSANRALLTTYSMAAAGVVSSWAAYVPPLAVLSSGSAAGLAILSVVASLALGQRLWARAQKHFWRDWSRITSMLKGDLETQFTTALDTSVLAQSREAAQGLDQLVKRRQDRLDKLQQQVDDLRRRIYPA